MPHNPYIDPQDIEDSTGSGYIYLIEAINVTGIIPGCLIRRCKIGLSSDPEKRLKRFEYSQFPCDVKIIRAIYVEDMRKTEKSLHSIFEVCNIKLKRSKEWFNLSPWQYARVHWVMSQHEIKQPLTFADIPKRALAGGLIALLGVGVMIGHIVRPDAPQIEPVTATEQKEQP